MKKPLVKDELHFVGFMLNKRQYFLFSKSEAVAASFKCKVAQFRVALSCQSEC